MSVRIQEPTSPASDEMTCSAVDLSQYSDLEVLRIVGAESPDFVDLLASQIDSGRSDEYIIKAVCEAGGSAQAMRYGKKLLTALRNLPNAKCDGAAGCGPNSP
jgi:hypothetical protein